MRDLKLLLTDVIIKINKVCLVKEICISLSVKRFSIVMAIEIYLFIKSTFLKGLYKCCQTTKTHTSNVNKRGKGSGKPIMAYVIKEYISKTYVINASNISLLWIKHIPSKLKKRRIEYSKYHWRALSLCHNFL